MPPRYLRRRSRPACAACRSRGLRRGADASSKLGNEMPSTIKYTSTTTVSKIRYAPVSERLPRPSGTSGARSAPSPRATPIPSIHETEAARTTQACWDVAEKNFFKRREGGHHIIVCCTQHASLLEAIASPTRPSGRTVLNATSRASGSSCFSPPLRGCASQRRRHAR